MQSISEQIFYSKVQQFGSNYEKMVKFLLDQFSYIKKINIGPENKFLVDLCIGQAIFQRLQYRMQTEGELKEQVISKMKNMRSAIVKYGKLSEEEVSSLEMKFLKSLESNDFKLGQQQRKYLIKLIRATAKKNEESSWFQSPPTYKPQEIKKLVEYFQVDLLYFDYDEDKKAPLIHNFSKDKAYVLKAKGNCFILYYKPKDTIQQKNSGTVSQEDLMKVFNCQSFLGENQESSLIFADTVECSRCHQETTEFDSINWKEIVCGKCLADPLVPTCDIPDNLIYKFFENRPYEKRVIFNCFQCQSQIKLTVKLNYKPNCIICPQCDKILCIEHRRNGLGCFCWCVNCKSPTIKIEQQLRKLCLKCNKSYCMECQTETSGLTYCKCLCKKCGVKNSKKKDKHVCQLKCHDCFNNYLQWKQCQCSKPLCYACYYAAKSRKLQGGDFCIQNANKLLY